MPVRFQKSSEYRREFQWVDSVKSSSFVPSHSQTQAPAGLSSEKIGKTMEPPLQHKKRPASTELVSKSWEQGDNEAEPQMQRKKKTPPSATSLAFYADDVQRDPDDFMLLGNQSKFSNNVVYKSKQNVNNFGKTKKVNKNDESNGRVSHSAERSPPAAPREKPAPPPPPRVTVDPGAPKLPKKRIEPPKEAPKPPVKSKSAPAVSVATHQRQRETEAPPPRPPKQHHSKDDERKYKEHKHREEQRHREEQAKQQKPKDRREKRAGHMNEFVQTNLDKGVADSGQEAGADYALKYRSGVAPPRPKGPKRLSEYQMQFEWKKGIASSPLIAAEQVVYNSNPQVAPYKAESFVKASEYKAQFKPYQVAASVPDMAAAKSAAAAGAAGGDAKDADRKHRHKSHKKQKIQRSRSLEDLTPDKRAPAGSGQDVSASDKRLVKGSLNPQKLHFPHGKLRKHKSEYEMNFQAPSKYEYVAGAWKGADPPHLQSKKNPEPQNEVPAEPATSWYLEVRELREKAQEYKKRAQGTHFSREHLAQLYAQQADLWDTVSTSSVLSALSLEVAGSEDARKPSKKQTAARKSAWEAEEQDLSLDLGSSASVISGSVVSSSRGRSSTRASSRASSISSRASTLVADDASNEGRIPTPKMLYGGKAKRHHLDRTTPAVGGALLTSPPRPQGSSYRSVSPSEESESVRSPPAQVARPEYTPEAYTKKRSKHNSRSHKPRQSTSAPTVLDHSTELRQSGPTPTFGMPTRDTHPLLDEEASTDRTLQTHYVHSPPQDKSAKRRQAREKFQVDVPSTINEDGGATYNEPLKQTKKTAWVQVGLDDIPQRSQDDDLLSVSAMSVASSCSLASEVLERARHRRDEFWGNPQGMA